MRGNHGGGIVEKESMRRSSGGEVIEDESQRRNHRGIREELAGEGVMARRCPGGTQEAARRC